MERTKALWVPRIRALRVLWRLLRPLALGTFLVVAVRLLGLPPVFHVAHTLSEWLSSVTAPGTALLFGDHGAPHLSHTVEWILLGFGALLALVFAHKGFHAYRDGIEADEKMEKRAPQLAGFLAGAWKIDASYTQRIVRPIQLMAFFIATVVDQLGIDGFVGKKKFS